MSFVSLSMAMSDAKFIKVAKAAGLRSETRTIRRIVAEAQTNHTWAKYPPGAGADAIAAPRVTGNVKVDLAAAKTALLALS